MTNLVPACKVETDDFKVEYEILSPIDITDIKNPEKRKIILEMQNLDNQINAIEEEIHKMNVEINRLTDNADGFDYSVAVASGILTGLIDSIFVGEADYRSAIEKADKQIAEKVKEKALKEKQNETVKKAVENAKKKGKKLSKTEIEKIKENVKEKFFSDPNHISDNGQDPVLKRAIRYLEKKHPALQDNLYVGTGSRPETHHLDDIAHHASLAGMIASIVVQFFRVATFVNKDGKWKFKIVKTDFNELLQIWLPIVISGILNWLIYISESACDAEKGEKIPEPILKLAHLLASAPAIVSVIKTVDDWCLHLCSDIAGSQSSKGRGAGIPGLFLSLLKELSGIFPLNHTGLPKVVEHLYNDNKFDMRAEIGVINELGRQALPIIINEVLVRTFYFVRNLISEYKKQGSFENIDWQKIIPFGNRTVERMMTIAAGTFTTVDIADAVIRSGGFYPDCLLRVNFVGVGRLAIAIVADVGMGIKQNNLMYERIDALSRQMTLLNAKVSYKCAEVYLAEKEMHKSEELMWVSAQSTNETLNEVYQIAEESVIYISESLVEIQNNFEKISRYRDAIDVHNKGLKKDIINIAKWGKK